MPNNLIESVTGVVLAGGKSTRMGTDKALMRVGEQTLLERCVTTLQRCFARNLLIANRPEAFSYLQFPVFRDDVPNLGPLGGICTALRRVQTPAIFVVACDMPFLNADLIRAMASALGELDAVAAEIGGRFEPLHAAYQRRILPLVEARIAAGDCSVYRLLEVLRVRSFTEANMARFPDWQRSLLNLNTPEDLERARQMS